MRTPQTFEFQTLVSSIVEQGIRVAKEDVLHNWTDSTLMIISSSGKPFRVGKEMHLLILEALIRACLKPKLFVVDFATSTSMYYFKHCIVALDIHSIISFNIFLHSSNSVLACCDLG
jgi:hypothetical protein